VGSVNERPGITGISHFFEHMMFKGTNTIGTRDPKADAEYRAKQKDIRDQINMITWTEQYGRYFRGEIDDPWNPANDTTKLKELRAELKRLMDAQQGRLHGDTLAKMKAELARIDRSSPGGETQAKEMEKEILRLEAEQTGKASIVKDEFDQIYTKAGGSGMNAFTGYDQTFFFINVPSNKFELWAWMSDVFAPKVHPQAFSKNNSTRCSGCRAATRGR
jgi:predicted Zn-dependent peptidase